MPYHFMPGMDSALYLLVGAGALLYYGFLGIRWYVRELRKEFGAKETEGPKEYRTPPWESSLREDR